jgi:Zn-dependent peptidase ImmA (M78 family)
MMGNRIKIARKYAGLSLRELAKYVNVSAQAISKYERDITNPNSEVIIKIADATGLSIDFFFNTAPPINIQPFYRKKASLKINKQEKIKSQIAEWLERYITIESFFPEQKNLYSPPEGSWEILNQEDIEKAAINLRNVWGLGLEPFDSLIEVLEEKGIKVGIVDGEEGFDACMFFNGDQPVIAIGKNLLLSRQRFSIAHELGHLILKPGEELNEEKTAHRFAGAFLVPAPKVKLELGSSRSSISIKELLYLKKKYGLSMQGWIYRAKDLGIINEHTYRNLWQYFSRQGWRKKEPEELAGEESTRIERLVYRALEEDIISISKASMLLKKDIQAIRSGLNKTCF